MMKSLLLVLTGTEAAGKSTIADELVRRELGTIVQAVTTRAPRPDDTGQYEYLTDKQFSRYEDRDELAVRTRYRENRYGIRSTALRKAVATGKIPVLVLSPQSFDDFQHRHSADYQVVSVFVDADDAILDTRLGERMTAQSTQRREDDRSCAAHATYLIHNDRPLLDIVNAVETLLSNRSRSGILPRQIIARLMRGGLLLTNASDENVQAASYDLSLGDEYFYGGRIKSLSASDPILTIEPYDSAIVTSRERACMPRDTAGRFDLSVGLFSQGVILSNGPQIDPGFEGNLFCLLLNTSSSPVLLRRGQHYATLEFSKLMEPSDKPYAGSRQGKQSILDYLPTNAARGAINELKRDLEQLRKEGARMQTFFIAALSLMFAVSALFMATR